MSFKSLVNIISEQCQEIKEALGLFPYFKTWDENVIAECCRLGSIVEFSPDKLILGPGAGKVHMVHFILSGTCKMIDQLHVRITTDSYGKKKYQLYEPIDTKNSSSKSSNIEYTSLLFNEKHEFQKRVPIEDIIDVTLKSEAEPKVQGYPEVQEEAKLDSGPEMVENKVENEEKHQEDNEDLIPIEETIEELKEKGLPETEHDLKEIEKEILNSKVEVKIEVESDTDPKISEIFEGQVNSHIETEKTRENSTPENGITKQDPILKIERSEYKPEEPVEDEVKEVVYESDHHIKILDECKAKCRNIKKIIEQKSLPEKPGDAECFFVQVGVMIKGGCFGLEGNLKNRFILSATKVKCLMIPRRFLFQHNPCNIWNRIKLFHRLYLPKDEIILKQFVANREWEEYKKKETLRIVSLKNIPNYNISNEIPFSIRLSELPR